MASHEYNIGYCVYCGGTAAENAALGKANHCEAAATSLHVNPDGVMTTTKPVPRSRNPVTEKALAESGEVHRPSEQQDPVVALAAEVKELRELVALLFETIAPGYADYVDRCGYNPELALEMCKVIDRE